MSYVTNMFLLVSSLVRSKQLLCFVHGQGQKQILSVACPKSKLECVSLSFGGDECLYSQVLLRLISRLSWKEIYGL